MSSIRRWRHRYGKGDVCKSCGCERGSAAAALPCNDWSDLREQGLE